MDESNIENGRHKFCGGKVVAYKQNRPFANYLIGCIYCGDYFNVDNLPKGVFELNISLIRKGGLKC